MNKSRQPFWGTASINEETHFFIFNKDSSMPIKIENIGYTPPHPRYCIQRDHNNYFVLEYVISGKGYLEINGKTYELEAGDIYCIEPGYDHLYYSDTKEPFEKMWINFFSDFFVDVFKTYGISGKFVFKKCKCIHLFHELQRIAKISNYSDEICFQISSIIFQIVCIMAENAHNQTYISDNAKHIKEYLDNALFSNITIEEIALQMHLSKIQITREFTKYYNQTPYNYLLTIKIKMAEQLLIHSNLRVNEISDKLAFSDPHYFSRIFKKKTGLPPSEYQQSKK